jgi:hypothetical protein
VAATVRCAQPVPVASGLQVTAQVVAIAAETLVAAALAPAR